MYVNGGRFVREAPDRVPAIDPEIPAIDETEEENQLVAQVLNSVVVREEDHVLTTESTESRLVTTIDGLGRTLGQDTPQTI